jgi:hypothetical protein
MFNFYKHCLFCFSPLPEIPSGAGEHVYPKSIFGFWRIYDVCENCMKHFGDNIDQLALQNPQILKAMEQLELPNADRYYEQIKYEGTDTIDGIKVKMVLKDGDFKTKAQEINENFFECSEKDWENIGIRWLKNKTNLSESDFQKEVEKLKEEYISLEPGETVISTPLGFSVRKRSVKDVKIDEENLNRITPLIAKIVVSFIHYFLTVDELVSLDEVEDLIKHSRHSEELQPYTINWCSLTEEPKYNKFHRVLMNILGNSIFIDVTFFGYPNWRIILNSKNPIIMHDLDGRLIKQIIFIQDFEDLENRQKHVGFVYDDDETPTYYEANI